VNLKMLLRAARRHKVVFSVAVGLGLIAGVVFTALSPPLLASTALVVALSRSISTQVVIAGSDTVLARAKAIAAPGMSLQEVSQRVSVTNETASVLVITARGKTAAAAEDLADAVARSYVAYVSTPNPPGGPVKASVEESATPATGVSLRTRAAETAVLGALLGAVIGLIAAAGIERGDRRLRERDEIAGAIGVPVVASLAVAHPADAADWTRLFEDYRPGVVHAWSLRKVLRQLGLTDFRPGRVPTVSVTILSLSADRASLAVGPQLAVFAASLGCPTTLVISPQQDTGATAALSAACTIISATPAAVPGPLQFAIGTYPAADRNHADLTVAVTVVDSRTLHAVSPIRTTATLLAVSAGTVTAEQLARLALSVTSTGRDITGIIVADPDPADRTTGRLAHLTQPAPRRQPDRPTTPAETRR